MEPYGVVNSLAEAVSYLQIFGRKPTAHTVHLKVSIEAVSEVLVEEGAGPGEALVRCRGDVFRRTTGRNQTG